MGFTDPTPLEHFVIKIEMTYFNLTDIFCIFSHSMGSTLKNIQKDNLVNFPAYQ